MALIAVVVMLAVIGAVAADFAYDAQVDFAGAINARDDLRAHYLARSGIQLARLMLRVQQQLIDPQIKRRKIPAFIQVADYAPMLVQAFNSEEGAQMLGGLFGVEGEVKGMGVDVGGFDLEMESLDGRVNLNCGGGANAGAPAVVRTAATLSAMMLPERFNAMFEKPDDAGQYNDRLTVLRAVIDWADMDRQLYGSTAPEDYRYDTGKEPYQNKNHYFDTLDELRLVRGVGDDFMDAFGEQLTVYGGCKANLDLISIPTIQALIMQYAASPSDPGLDYRNLALLARYVVAIREMSGGFPTVSSFIEAVANPMAQLGVAASADALLSQGQSQQPDGLLPVIGVKLNSKVGESTWGSWVQRIWRIKAKAKVGQLEKTITAIWDQEHRSMHAGQASLGPGGFVYWREE